MKQSKSLPHTIKIDVKEDDYAHNRNIVKGLSIEIEKKYLFHQKKFRLLRNINRFVVITTTVLNSMGLSSLGIYFFGEGKIPAIIAMALNSISFIISSVALAFQLNSKSAREKILGGLYHDLHRDIGKTLIIREDSFSKDFVEILVDNTIEKIQIIEDFESDI